VVVLVAVLAIVVIVNPFHREPSGCKTSPCQVLATNDQPIVNAIPPTKIVSDLSAEIPPEPISAIDGEEQVFAEFEELMGTGFGKTAIAREWVGQGVTVDDVHTALDQMRTDGATEGQLKDPGLIGQLLPRRNIEPAYLDDVDMPAEIAAGASVAFVVSANYPDPSYQFTSWEIERKADVIEVRMKGEKRVGNVAAVVVPVELEGALPGLVAGEYKVLFSGLGEPIERSLTVQ